MGTLAYLILGTGLLGILSRPVLGGLVLVGWLVLLALRRMVKRDAPALREEPDTSYVPSSCSELLIAVAVCVPLLAAAVQSLVSALGPVGGLDWDSLSYHLAAPKIYLHDGRIGFIAYDSHTQFPFTMEMLYTLGLAFAGPGGAKLFHWAAGWLAALAVWAWTSRLRVGGRTTPLWAGPLAAAIFITPPLVMLELGTAYVDLGTTLFQFLALAAAVDAVQVVAGKTRVELGGVALAGVLTGFALGTKMTGLVQFGLLGLGLLYVAARTRGVDARLAAAKGVLYFGVLGVAVAMPWYLKSWLWVHNPVYPFFYSIFPRSFSWTLQAAAAYSAEQQSFGMGHGPGEFFLAPWNLAVHGRAFFVNQRSLIGDKLGSLGPVWIAVLPLGFWARGLDRRVTALAAYAGASLVAWFELSHQARYLIPLCAPLAVLATLVVAGIRIPGVKVAAGLFLAIALGLNLSVTRPIANEAWSVVSGAKSEADYLDRSLPGLYAAANFINTELPANSRVALYQETRGFYFDRKYFWANPLQHNLIPYDSLKSGSDLANELRRFGITHVLINCDPAFWKGVENSPWCLLLKDAMRQGRLEEVYRSPDAIFEHRGVLIYQLR